jgi:hypothetical protein
MITVKLRRSRLPILFVISLALYSCGEQPVKTVDLPDPVENLNDTAGLDNEPDYMEDVGVYSDSDFVEFKDTMGLDSAGNSTSASADTMANFQLPAGSSLKTIHAVFKTVDCDKYGCELFFETDAEEKLAFCGAYGDFVSADFGIANRELVGKKFMIIYRPENKTPSAAKDSTSKNNKGPCKTIVFAKQL